MLNATSHAKPLACSCGRRASGCCFWTFLHVLVRLRLLSRPSEKAAAVLGVTHGRRERTRRAWPASPPFPADVISAGCSATASAAVSEGWGEEEKELRTPRLYRLPGFSRHFQQRRSGGFVLFGNVVGNLWENGKQHSCPLIIHPPASGSGSCRANFFPHTFANGDAASRAKCYRGFVFLQVPKVRARIPGLFPTPAPLFPINQHSRHCCVSSVSRFSSSLTVAI